MYVCIYVVLETSPLSKSRISCLFMHGEPVIRVRLYDKNHRIMFFFDYGFFGWREGAFFFYSRPLSQGRAILYVANANASRPYDNYSYILKFKKIIIIITKTRTTFCTCL